LERFILVTYDKRVFFIQPYSSSLCLPYSDDKVQTILIGPKLKKSFIVGIIIIMTMLETGVTIINRNPLANMAGLEKCQSYLEKVQSDNAEAMQLLEQTPADIQVYFIFESRSYYAD
jgi:hypothetical protein